MRLLVEMKSGVAETLLLPHPASFCMILILDVLTGEVRDSSELTACFLGTKLVNRL